MSQASRGMLIITEWEHATAGDRAYVERWLDGEPECVWIHLTIPQAEVLASGYVPAGIKSQLREVLQCDLEDERRAGRPVETPKARKKRA